MTRNPNGRSQRRLALVALLILPLSWMTVFYLIPIGVLLAHSLFSVEYPDIDYSLTLENFKAFFETPLYIKVLLRTVIMATAVTLLCILLAFPISFWLAKRVRRHRERLLFLVIFPLWSSYLVRIFAWKTMLGTSGILNSFLQWAHITNEPISFLLYSKWAIIIALTHIWLPFMILPLYTVLDRLPDTLLEAATDLGAGWFATFRTVILPLAKPGLLAGSLATFSLTMGDYIAPTMLGGPGDQMIGKLIADQFGVANNWPMGATLIIPVLVIISLLLWASNRAGAMERTAA